MEKKQRAIRFAFLDKPFWNTRIKTANVTRREILLGYALGPFGALLLNSIINSYFNSYLTDVLGFTTAATGLAWVAVFMTVFPVLSKLLDAVTNVVMGKLIDMTDSRQGKIRPWMIISAPFVCLSFIMIFTTPYWSGNIKFQAIFVVVAYNLFYAFAYTMWTMSRSMGAPLSTRNIKQRHNNALAFSITENAGTGMISIFFALIIQKFATNEKNWLVVMVFFALIAFPLFLVQYFNTRERITEERRQHAELIASKGSDKSPRRAEASMLVQAKACLSDRMWVCFIIMIFLGMVLTQIKLTSLIYYSGWVVDGNCYGVRGTIQSRFQTIALSPMGPGIILLVPLLKKVGRTRIIVLGSVLAAVGSAIAFLGAGNTLMVYAGTALGGIGFIPYTYAAMTFYGDIYDHVEYKTGIRCDGFCVAAVSAITVACNGIALGIFNLGLNLTGYQVVAQEGTQLIYHGKACVDAYGAAIPIYQDLTRAATNWINFSYQGTQVLTAIVRIIMLVFFVRIDKVIDQVHQTIQQREKEECEKLGIPYVSSDERERREKEQQEEENEKARIEDLKKRCERKGLDFETENRKYLEKKAAKKAKKAGKAKGQG